MKPEDYLARGLKKLDMEHYGGNLGGKHQSGKWAVEIIDRESAYSELYEALERLQKASAEVLLRDVQNNRSDAAFGELNMAAFNANTALAHARGELASTDNKVSPDLKSGRSETE